MHPSTHLIQMLGKPHTFYLNNITSTYVHKFIPSITIINLLKDYNTIYGQLINLSSEYSLNVILWIMEAKGDEMNELDSKHNKITKFKKN